MPRPEGAATHRLSAGAVPARRGVGSGPLIADSLTCVPPGFMGVRPLIFRAGHPQRG